LTHELNDAPLLFDVTRLVWRRWKGGYPTGVDRVCLAYLRYFGDRAQAVIQHDRFRRILDRRASRELFRLLGGPSVRLRRMLPLKAVRHFGGLNASGRGRLYLNVGHTGLDSPGFRSWAEKSEVRPVYFVHDLIPISHPQYCRSGEAARHARRMRSVLTTATGVIGNSQTTLDELNTFARSENLSMPTSISAWLGLDAPPPSTVDVPYSRPTFIILGTIEARKNHIMLLRVWSRLIDRLGTAAPRLLIVGQRGWEAGPVFNLLDHSDELRNHVIELSSCSDNELAEHLARSRALLFPSIAEGYGLPLIEALGLGVPVIASDLPVFREIGVGIPDLLDPKDDDRWEASILDYAHPDGKTRQAQLTRMAGYRVPDWSSHFKAVERWLASLG
jgi:glycosyltransferase involved in cell wall biosynthesis